ncbi:MAG: hypothetical protein Tsb0021_17040 [Chlamydiales bacterium]
MWARHSEAFIGLWLALSYFIFRYASPYAPILMVNDLICSFLIIFFSISTYYKTFRYCHLLNFILGLWLLGWVFLSDAGIDFAPYQNYGVIGLLLLMLSIVPTKSERPPKAWIDFLEQKKME